MEVFMKKEERALLWIWGSMIFAFLVVGIYFDLTQQHPKEVICPSNLGLIEFYKGYLITQGVWTGKDELLYGLKLKEYKEQNGCI
jgi:hypothetical protein